MSAILLELDHVTKLFPIGGLFSRAQMKAVNDVSFALAADRPEIFAIVGESGCGKSTLAKMILGNESADSGSIRFDGADIAAHSAARRARPSWPRSSRSSRTRSRRSIR